MAAAPKFVLSAGIVGSGSTFLYNVARELLIHDQPAPVPLAVYSDEWSEQFVAPRSLIIKCHGGSPSLQAAAERGLVQPIVSIRHPGDCVCSDMERFGLSLAEALARVETSLAFSRRLCEFEGTAIFLYESGFILDPATPAAVAHRLGIAADDDVLSGIYARYEVEATRRFAEEIGDPPISLSNPANGDVWDRVTQIHRRHIGKLVSGRWRTLSKQARSLITERCADDASVFGYTFDC